VSEHLALFVFTPTPTLTLTCQVLARFFRPELNV
jgi:hypothetical protein